MNKIGDSVPLKKDFGTLLKYYNVTKKALKGMGKRNMSGPMGKLMRRMSH